MLGRRVVLAACSAALLAATGVAAGGPATAADGDAWIFVTEGKTKQIMAFDPNVTDWNSASALKWTWKPTAARGYNATEISKFGGGTDIKIRSSVDYGNVMAIADGTGLLTVARYPGGQKIWSKILTGNMHSAEWIPGVMVAAAASDGNWVQVFSAAPGSTVKPGYFKLNQAHATLWEPDRQRLWVTGFDQAANQHIVTALIVTKTSTAITLTEDKALRSKPLPTPWGHDLAAYYPDRNKLLVTTNGGAYLYDKVTRDFTGLPGGANRPFVKGIGVQRTGQIVETQSDSAKTPKGGCATVNAWCMESVDLFGPNGKRTRTGAQFYKMRMGIINHQ